MPPFTIQACAACLSISRSGHQHLPGWMCTICQHGSALSPAIPHDQSAAAAPGPQRGGGQAAAGGGAAQEEHHRGVGMEPCGWWRGSEACMAGHVPVSAHRTGWSCGHLMCGVSERCGIQHQHQQHSSSTGMPACLLVAAWQQLPCHQQACCCHTQLAATAHHAQAADALLEVVISSGAAAAGGHV